MADIKSGDVVGVGGVKILGGFVAGAAADTDIAVPGLSWAKNPQFVRCMRIEGSATYATEANLLAEVKEGTVDGAIQLETTVTTGDSLDLLWVQEGSN